MSNNSNTTTDNTNNTNNENTNNTENKANVMLAFVFLAEAGYPADILQNLAGSTPAYDLLLHRSFARIRVAAAIATTPETIDLSHLRRWQIIEKINKSSGCSCPRMTCPVTLHGSGRWCAHDEGGDYNFLLHLDINKMEENFKKLEEAGLTPAFLESLNFKKTLLDAAETVASNKKLEEWVWEGDELDVKVLKHLLFIKIRALGWPDDKEKDFLIQECLGTPEQGQNISDFVAGQVEKYFHGLERPFVTTCCFADSLQVVFEKLLAREEINFPVEIFKYIYRGELKQFMDTSGFVPDYQKETKLIFVYRRAQVGTCKYDEIIKFCKLVTVQHRHEFLDLLKQI